VPAKKLIVVEHNVGTGHHILLNNTSILARMSRCMYQLVREAIEMKPYANTHHKRILSHAEHYSVSSVPLTAQSSRHSFVHVSLLPPAMLLPYWVLIMTLQLSTFHFPFSTNNLSKHIS